MSKLNYGPKFGTTIVSSKYHYDETLDRDMSKDSARIQSIWQTKPQYLHELRTEKAVKTKKRKRDAIGTGREDAELRMVDALREAVTLLEFHMAEMMDNKIKPNHHSMVNQQQIANALYHLKHKCGVGFDDDTYKARVPLYEYEPSLLPMRDANLDERMKEQREARSKRRQRIIDRLLARPKKGEP